jgi:hypothetical protein
MECGKSLALPKDIPWKRLAYSLDMTDVVMDMGLPPRLPPKWKSSLAVFYYEVPEEDTIDDYPDRRLVFLKVSASVTGFNPCEAPVIDRTTSIPSNEPVSSGDVAEGEYNAWRHSLLSGWAARYFPCYGAILQVSVYPHKNDLEFSETSEGIAYTHMPLPELNIVYEKIPYIMDFEPKKREIFEAKSESGEFLTASSSKLNTGKSHSDTKTLSVSAEISAGSGGVGGSVGVDYQKTTQDINSTNKEWSREKRESFSHTTSLNQIYSIFDGYHLGTNRAMFVIQPRPHMMDSDFNLIDGLRRLEGIQDVFLVVSVPKENKGLCVQAHLDTGHINEHEEYIARVKKESEMSLEDYEKTLEILNIPLDEIDLSLEGMVNVFNIYNNLEEDEYTRHRTTVEVVGRDLVIKFGDIEIMRMRFSDVERPDEELETILADIKNRFFPITTDGSEQPLEKLYVIYDKVISRRDRGMFMTRRIVQNCALFDKETGLLNPTIHSGELPHAEVADSSFTYEASMALVSAPNHDDLRDPAKKSALVHSYNKLSNQMMKNMLNAYSSSAFKPKGVSLTETEMFKRNLTLKLVNMPDYHPANMELSKLKDIDKKTLEQLKKFGVKRIKDLFVSKPMRAAKAGKAEKVPYTIILDLQNKILGGKTPRESENNLKQQSAQKKQPTNKKEEYKK